MDTEAQIVEQLRNNIAVPEPHVPPPVVPPEDTSGAAIIPPVELDELTMFKMYDYFGEQYRGSNADHKTYLQFIYDTLSEQLGTRDYTKVMNSVYDLEHIIGTSHSGDRIGKLYNWVGLDKVRRNAEASMRLLRG